MRNWRITLTLGALLGSLALSQGQSINIDLNDPVGGPETGAGVPSSAFGAAANQPGFWNGVTASGSGPFSLKGLDGQPTSIQLSATGGTGVMGGFNFPGNSGDFRLLMNDEADLLGANHEIDYHFSGLSPGSYLIYTYAANTAGLTVDVSVTVPSSGTPVQHVTGPMLANVFQLGITHTVHQIELTGTTVEIDVHTTNNSNLGQCNGFQIVTLVPEPATVFACSLGLLSFIAVRRSRM